MLLHFERFDVQESNSCSNDSVSLKYTKAEEERRMFCGNTLPHDGISSSNEVNVVFKSDSSVTSKGFVISYEASSTVFGKEITH